MNPRLTPLSPDSAPYGLEPDPTPPALPGAVTLKRDEDDVFDSLAAAIVAAGMHAVEKWGAYHIALSGGSTPMPLYRRLMIDPNCRKLPWERTHLWIVDERCVPFDHEKSNWRQIKEIIADHADIPAENVHPMEVLLPDCDARYEDALRKTLGFRPKGEERLDFVLLGMGDDGHTASLFPQSPALSDGGKWVLKNDGPRVVPPARCTMTYALLNRARQLAVLCLGKKKKPMLTRVAAKADAPAELPILGIRPDKGELRWYLDHAAIA
jgi:hexose-6-phosphate dehydrogenase